MAEQRNEEGIDLVLIGHVSSRVKEPIVTGWGGVSEILVGEAFGEALKGLEGFSHLIVIFWMHRVSQEGRASLTTIIEGSRYRPEVGVFATRSQNRINPFGVAVVRLISSRENVLIVEGLDAIDGTPVLDIKPYLPPYDSVPNAKVPPWVWD